MMFHMCIINCFNFKYFLMVDNIRICVYFRFAWQNKSKFGKEINSGDFGIFNLHLLTWLVIRKVNPKFMMKVN